MAPNWSARISGIAALVLAAGAASATGFMKKGDIMAMEPAEAGQLWRLGGSLSVDPVPPATGCANVQFLIEADGTTGPVNVIRTLPEGLADAAKAAMERAVFESQLGKAARGSILGQIGIYTHGVVTFVEKDGAYDIVFAPSDKASPCFVRNFTQLNKLQRKRK